MSFTGFINYTFISPNIPVGCFLLVGADAHHYMVLTRSYTEFAKIGHIEGNTVVKNLDRATIRNDFASLSLSGHTGTYQTPHIMPITGTSQFIVLMAGTGGTANENHVGGVRYKINSTSSVTV